MPISAVYECQCADCQGAGEHPDKEIRHQTNLLASRLDAQQRRWFVAMEANRLGHGGIQLLSQIPGTDEKTIERGQQELKQGWAEAQRSRCVPLAVDDPG
ncbi:MAG: hypothetical protein ABSG98_03515 [Anaerolineales bacterium]